ncbi:unnamed protein product [Soboliphyme baturini]|uniref:START domain-containing protein n=1 Tax=Soboliphyme baturini TaxID=241478 RepID=A0A3P8EDL7_9BILA|nr:unnamed protein product [Soboliphyme baturini]
MQTVKDSGSVGLLAAAVFSFSKDGIGDDEVRRAILNSGHVEKRAAAAQLSEQVSSVDDSQTTSASAVDSDWELLLRQEDLRVYRRRVSNRVNFFEYKCEGTYRDISPMKFYQAQMDLEYRKCWDHQIISIDVLEKDENTGSEVIRWIMRFPYPMYPREYTFVRRSCIDPDKKTIVITCKAVHRSLTPKVKKCVSVRDYFSCMTIRYRSDITEV